MTTIIHVVGTIATDPKLINPSSGTQLCSFRLASDERRYDREKQQWVDGDTNWFGVVSFRSLASHAHESFRKGDRVMVTGRLRMRKWEKDDRRGTSPSVTMCAGACPVSRNGSAAETTARPRLGSKGVR